MLFIIPVDENAIESAVKWFFMTIFVILPLLLCSVSLLYNMWGILTMGLYLEEALKIGAFFGIIFILLCLIRKFGGD